LKDFSENIVEIVEHRRLAVDLSGIVRSWNTRMEQLLGNTSGSGRPQGGLAAQAELAGKVLRAAAKSGYGHFTRSGCAQHQGKLLTV